MLEIIHVALKTPNIVMNVWIGSQRFIHRLHTLRQQLPAVCCLQCVACSVVRDSRFQPGPVHHRNFLAAEARVLGNAALAAQLPKTVPRNDDGSIAACCSEVIATFLGKTIFVIQRLLAIKTIEVLTFSTV